MGKNFREQKHRISTRCSSHPFWWQKFRFLLSLGELEQATRHQVQFGNALSRRRTLPAPTQHLRHPHRQAYPLAVVYLGEVPHSVGGRSEKFDLHTSLFFTTLIISRETTEPTLD